MKFIRNYKVSLPIAGVVIAGLAWLAFGFFGIHTAFIDNEVAEDGPVFDAQVADPVSDTDAADAATQAAAADTDARPAAADDASDSSTDVAAANSAPADTAPADTAPADTAPANTAPATTAAPAEPVVVTEASGAFAGTSRYDVTGDALVLGNGTGQRFLRFENFESSNGPDLSVYLFNPDDSSDFVDLGSLKGNIGDQNYEIPESVDLERYSEVSIWCVRFSTAFGSADLAAA